MQTNYLAEQTLLGLFEVDENGSVLYSSIESNGSTHHEPDINGRNFFTQVAPFSNASDFERRFELFTLSETQSHSFGFTCQYGDGPVLIKVLMARLNKSPTSCSSLIHLRKA